MCSIPFGCGFDQSNGLPDVVSLKNIVVEIYQHLTPQSTPTYQVQPQKSPKLHGTVLDSLNSLPIPAYTSPTLQYPQHNTEHEDIPFIPGGGLTRRILGSLPDAWTIPTVSLLQFVLEGDNRADARLFAAVVAKVINLDSSIEEWRSPSSWNQGLFGAPHDQTLYG